jgi:hypothetical protein
VTTAEQLYEAHIEQLPAEQQLELLSIIAQHLALRSPKPSRSNGAKSKQKRRRSVIDILGDAPGHRLFETAADVDLYLAEERRTWDS